MIDRFWRFAYDSDSEAAAAIDTGSLHCPGTLSTKPKSLPVDVIRSKLRVGDGIVLADFDEDRAVGTVIAIGVVTQRTDGGVVVNWKRERFELYPSPQGGVPMWRKEACFKFAADPAARYRLAERFARAFGE